MAVKWQQPAQGLSVPAARNQTSPPNSDTSEQERKIYIYIDHSNFWVEPYNRSGYQWRYDIASFRSLLIRLAAKTGNMDRRNVQAEVNVYGYVPDCLKPIWKSQGARIHELRKSFAADLQKGIEREHGEKEVDTSLVAHSVRKAVEAWYDEDPEAKSVFVIVSGDRDMRPAVEQIIECEHHVHVWAWNDTMSKVYEDLSRDQSLVTFHRLDDYKHRFVHN